MLSAEAAPAIERGWANGTEIWRAGLLYLFLTLVLAYPLALNPGGSVMPGDADTNLFMWTLGWNTHALVHDPLHVFDANIYYPHQRTLAFSENLIGSTIVAAPVLWLTGNPILALNVVALLSIALSGVGGYVLARQLGISRAGALVCGAVLAFSPARFFRLGQLHLTTIQWIPFCLASLHAYLRSGRPRDLRLAAGFFTLQAVSSGHGAALLTVGVSALLAFHFLPGAPLAAGRRLRDLGIPGALLFAPAMLIFIPYRHVQTEFNLHRTLADWKTTPESFLSSVSIVHSYLLSLAGGRRLVDNPSAHLFPGILAIVLAAVACLWRVRRPSRPAPRRRGSAVTAAALFLEGLFVVALLVALSVALTGPVRLRAGGVLLFSARQALRPSLIALAALGLRWMLRVHVPLEIRPRALGLLASLRKGAEAARHSAILFYALLAVLSICLAAGPPIGIWPYVYELPGLNFIRVPSRFGLLLVICLGVLAGFGFDRLTMRRTRGARRIALTAALFIIVAECLSIPLPAHKQYAVEIPAVDRWLAGQPKPFVVAEFPVIPSDSLQSTYMLHSMAHWQKTVHGYSGIRTGLHIELYRQLESFPDDVSVAALSRLGVDYLIVHTDLYPADEWARVDAALAHFGSSLHLVHTDGTGRVYALRAR